MALGSFLINSLGLSVWVFLRMIPVMIAMGALVVGLIISITNPIVMAMLAVVIGFLGTPFFYLTGIRAGLAAMGETEAPALEKLLGSSMRLLFMQLLPSGLLTLLLSGLGVTLIFGALYGAAPDLFGAFSGDATPESLAALGQMIPMLLFIFYISSSVGFAVFAVPMGATAANAVRKSPGYDMIWGIGKQFLPVFTVTFLVTAMPAILFTAFVPGATLLLVSNDPELFVNQVGTGMLVMTALYLLITILGPFIILAAVALAFVLQRDEVEMLKEAETAAIFAGAESDEDRRDNLRELRRARAGLGETTNVYQPGAAPAPAVQRVAPPRKVLLEPDSENVFKDDDDSNIFR